MTGAQKAKLNSVLQYALRKRQMIVCVIVVMAVVSLFAYVFRGITVNEIIDGERCFIWGEREAQITLQIPVSALPQDIYEKGGHRFEENEVVVYQTDNTTIYLKQVMPANEGDDQLYFCFGLTYDLTEKGQILTIHRKVGENEYTFHNGLSSDVLTDDRTSHEDAVHVRGYGPGENFMLYVDTEVCKAAEGTIRLEAYCWEIDYERQWPWS